MGGGLLGMGRLYRTQHMVIIEYTCTPVKGKRGLEEGKKRTTKRLKTNTPIAQPSQFLRPSLPAPCLARKLRCERERGAGVRVGAQEVAEREEEAGYVLLLML